MISLKSCRSATCDFFSFYGTDFSWKLRYWIDFIIKTFASLHSMNVLVLIMRDFLFVRVSLWWQLSIQSFCARSPVCESTVFYSIVKNILMITTNSIIIITNVNVLSLSCLQSCSQVLGYWSTFWGHFWTLQYDDFIITCGPLKWHSIWMISTCLIVVKSFCSWSWFYQPSHASWLPSLVLVGSLEGSSGGVTFWTLAPIQLRLFSCILFDNVQPSTTEG
jgi:hypothetical protein